MTRAVRDSGNAYSHRACWKDQPYSAQLDRSVFWHGKRIGRITYTTIFPSGPTWVWSCQFNIIIHDQSGFAPTREIGLEEVRMRHEREGCPGPLVGARPMVHCRWLMD